MKRKYMEGRQEKHLTGDIPDFGAIFMSSKSTKKECLRKKLFGLPSSFNNFIRHVKTGMLLFLFEYESRQLNGVYEATSDGAIDIIPHAYTSSGKKFPAQVKIKIVWECQPLLEDEFYDAIKDNYFQSFKFNFGLSKDQVHNYVTALSSPSLFWLNLCFSKAEPKVYHLLRLFQQKRVWTQETRVFSTRHVYQKEESGNSSFEDQDRVICKGTGHDISKLCTQCDRDGLYSVKEDYVIDSQLISSSGASVTNRIKTLTYCHPYDPDKPYFCQFPACSETRITPFVSGTDSGSQVRLGGRSNDLYMVKENVDSSVVARDIELGDFIPVESSPYIEPHRPTTRTSNPDCYQAASLSSRLYGYSETSQNYGFLLNSVQDKAASSSHTDEDRTLTYEAGEHRATLDTRLKRLGVLEQTDYLYTEDHGRICHTTDLDLEDFVPIDSSPCAKPYYPTTRITIPDRHQVNSLSSRRFGYRESHQNGFSPHREKVVSFSQNNEDQECIYEANERESKSCSRSKSHSVFSRIRFSPKHHKMSDSDDLSSNDATRAIMEQLQRKHDNWSKKVSRKNFNGHEEGEATYWGRRVSVFSNGRLKLNLIKPGDRKSRATIKIPERNSGEMEKGNIFDKLDSQVAEEIDSIENFEFSSSPAEKVMTRTIYPESGSSAQKQSKRRKLIRPVLDPMPLSSDSFVYQNSDSQLPCERDQASKEEIGRSVAPSESVFIGDAGLAESLSLVGKEQVSRASCEKIRDDLTAKSAIHEVPMEPGSNDSLLTKEPES